EEIKPEETTEAETEGTKPEETEEETEAAKPEEIGRPGTLASGSNASGSGSQGAGSGSSGGAGSESSQKKSLIPTAEELEAMSMEAILELFWSLDEEGREKLISLLSEEDQEEFFEYMMQQALGETIVVERDIQSYTEVAPFLPPVSVGKARKMSRSRSAAAMEGMEGGTDSWIQPDGVITNKTIDKKEDGTYELTLEAYVEGQVSIVTEMAPTDIVLVLDESGSMRDSMTSTSYTKIIGTVTNGGLYQGIDAGNKLVYRLEDGSFAKVNLRRSGYWPWSYTYTYTYTDLNGKRVAIESSGSGTSPFNAFSDNFKQENLYWDIGGSRRVDVLKDSLNQFVENIAASEGSEEHRIAIVGFSGSSSIKTGFVPVQEGDSINAALTKAIGSLETEGATRSDLGLENAKKIFDKDSQNEEKRNRVVILFTDGEPNGHSGFDSGVADRAIGFAKSMKANGVTVYTIGIFDGANPAQDPTSTSSNRNQTNRYMHYVSSNYPEASNLNTSGSIRNEGYYLAAKDSQDLNSIFEQISQEVGSADYALDETTIIRDIITPEFKLPEGASEDDISVSTADYRGNGKWGSLEPFDGADITVDGKRIDVSNFDFQADGNFVTEGTDPSGKKLVIQIPIEPDYSETFGGGTKPTNAEGSGLWMGGKGVTPFIPCEAYVPIHYETSVTDQAIYLTNQPDFEKLIQFVDGFTPNGVNNQNVDITYTFQKGEQEVAVYTIPEGKTSGIVEIKDKTLWEKDDTEYTVVCRVKSKEGTESAEAVQTKQTATVYILKPTLTFQDSQIYLGEKPESYDQNKDESLTLWSNASKPEDLAVLDDGITHGKPVIQYEFSPLPESGEWETDTYVSAKIKIGETDITEETAFVHSSCNCRLNKTCQFDDEKEQNKGQFIIHVLPCSLTVQKVMGNGEGDKLESNDQVFLFRVTGLDEQTNSGVDLLISITGTGSKTITGLPVGSYRVEENENWSWRYQAKGETVQLSSGTPKGQVTIVNHLSNRQWLSDEAEEMNRFHGKQRTAAVREVAYLREEKYEF
ncbi:MAG: VWA domain-containing protein, partial [Lachnospiraceae bacterium]|nr:VWA domain-containing protein [Lachnospiraceae bacterium]